jgi:ferredoxin
MMKKHQDSFGRLFTLLYVKTYETSFPSLLFHSGLTGSVITAIMLELSRFLYNIGWFLTWIHGFFGGLIVISWPYMIFRYFSKPSVRLLQNRVFLIDAISISIMMISGFIVTLTTFGIMDPTPNIWPSLHVTMAYTWALSSLLAGGRIRHALAMIVYGILGEKINSIYLLSDACGGCGACIEACMKITRKTMRDTPAYKIHKTLANPRKSQYIISENTLEDCKKCMACLSVCPIHWNKLRVIKKTS